MDNVGEPEGALLSEIIEERQILYDITHKGESKEHELTETRENDGCQGLELGRLARWSKGTNSQFPEI